MSFFEKERLKYLGRKTFRAANVYNFKKMFGCSIKGKLRKTISFIKKDYGLF